MKTVRRLLYATDLSRASLPAWEQAQLLGGLFEAEVLLLHVVPPVPLPAEAYTPPTLFRELLETGRQKARGDLTELMGTLKNPALKVSLRVEEGAAARRIAEVAAEQSVDLVVMGTHGRTGLGRVLLGSVADRVVRQAPCPALIVPARADGERVTGTRLARICYATDFSPSARAAWPWALALAEAAAADIDLVHVTPAALRDLHLPVEGVERLVRALQEQGHAAAEAFLRDCPLPRERVHVLIGGGIVSDQILHWARTRAADVIVMGTHGWAGLLRWMLGSVAQHVIQTAPCPILTVGPKSQNEVHLDVA